MLARAGVLAYLGAIVALALGLLTLNLILLLLGVAVVAFVASALLIFHLSGAVPDPSQIAVVVTEGTPRLPLGAEATIRLRITNEGSRSVAAAVVDTLPETLEVVVGTPAMPVTLEPGERLHLAYRVRARSRGRHELGPTLAFVPGPLGLVFDEVELAPSRPLLVTATGATPRSAPAGLGLYTRVRGRLALRHRGYGSEFRSLRAYELSDDIRHVAWRRSTPEQLLVREFDQESRQDYVLVFDVSPASLVGELGASSLDRAAEAGAVVAGFVERSAEDRIGMMTFADGVRQYFRPGRGSAHFRRIAENLALLRASPGRFDLAAVLDECVRRFRIHSHVFVFSTLSDPLSDIHSAHRRFIARGHHLYLFAGQTSGFYPPPDDPDAAVAFAWAQRVEAGRLERRLALLHAEGIPTFRYDRQGAVPKAVAAYGQIRAWGRSG